MSWLILWAMSTHEDTRGVVTANTDRQLTGTTGGVGTYTVNTTGRRVFHITLP